MVEGYPVLHCRSSSRVSVGLSDRRCGATQMTVPADTIVPGQLRVPRWALRIVRRLVALAPGRYVIILTVDGQGEDWTVFPVGKVER